MAAQQPSGSGKDSSSHTLGRSLLWPAAAVGLGFVLIYNSLDASAGSRPPVPSITAPRTSPATAHPALSRSVPERISIPRIAVDAPFTPLTIGSHGQLNAPPPDDVNLVGWFEGGATPGERGTSVVAGHVDTKTGPAVFLLLSTLEPGSKVDITREDGIVATFKVDSVETFSKASFPDDRVYNDTGSAQLRLITCGGAYDKEAKDYKDNVVVFAHLDSNKKA